MATQFAKEKRRSRKGEKPKKQGKAKKHRSGEGKKRKGKEANQLTSRKNEKSEGKSS